MESIAFKVSLVCSSLGGLLVYVPICLGAEFGNQHQRTVHTSHSGPEADKSDYIAATPTICFFFECSTLFDAFDIFDGFGLRDCSH